MANSKGREKIFTISDHVDEPSTSNCVVHSCRDFGISNYRLEADSALEINSRHHQITLCIGVQTDISQMNTIFSPLSGVSITPQTIPFQHSQFEPVAENSRWQRTIQNLDCTTFCYLAIAGLMIGVGILVTAVTARDKVINDDSNGSAQLWIVGPIFISSGILVCIKAATHLCKRVNESSQNGNFLSPDSRASLRGIPPSYSKALVAPVPSCVVEIEDATDEKYFDTSSSPEELDPESHRLVMIQCDIPPPTYNEAIEVIRRHSMSETKRLNVRDVGTQIGSEPQASGSLMERRVRNAFSESNVAQSALSE